MYFGRVVGCVWATAKDPRLTGRQLICTDSTGAGAGELVYWVRGKEASFPFAPDDPPVDTTVIGIVDEVHVQRKK